MLPLLQFIFHLRKLEKSFLVYINKVLVETKITTTKSTKSVTDRELKMPNVTK